jgi:hypothetical protein
MSYSTVATCVDDYEMQNRVKACFAEQGGSPTAVPPDLFWTVAGADDIEAAYASAIAADNPHPGSDPAVVTDQMILSVVQANMPAP